MRSDLAAEEAWRADSVLALPDDLPQPVFSLTESPASALPESLLPLNSTIHVHFWIFFCPGRKLNTFLKWNTESLLQRIQINLSLTFTIPHQAWHQGRQWLCPGISTACIRPQSNCVTKPEKTVSDRGSFYLSHMKNSFVIPFLCKPVLGVSVRGKFLTRN